jgi:hypothetical protein
MVRVCYGLQRSKAVTVLTVDFGFEVKHEQDALSTAVSMPLLTWQPVADYYFDLLLDLHCWR